ncbi:dolichol kinase [Coemansia spiralis]|nr:dolichol kinase [Coemansia spiralis]
MDRTWSRRRFFEASIPACMLVAGLWRTELPLQAIGVGLAIVGLLLGGTGGAPAVVRGVTSSMYRPAADDGAVWGILLVPLVLVARGSPGAWILGVAMSTAFAAAVCEARTRQWRAGLLALPAVVYAGVIGSPAQGWWPVAGALVMVGAAGAQHALTVAVLRALPRSFTLGEAAVAAQGAMLAAADLAGRVATRVQAGPGGAADAQMPAVLLEAGALALTLFACALARAPAGTVWFCGLAAAFAGGALGLAGLVAGANPLGWAWRAVLGSPAHWAVLCYWAVLLAGSAAVYVAAPGGGLAAGSSAKLALHVKRKAFHVLAVLLFAPAHAAAPLLLHVALTAALAAFVVVEAARAQGSGRCAAAVDRFLRRFTDARDAGPVVTAHFYLLLGCALPVWLGGSWAACLAGVLTLGVADTAASLVGLGLGRRRWPYSPKTVEGTAAFVCALFAALSLVPAAGAPGAALRLVLCAALGLLEALTEQNDNLVVALAAYAALTMHGGSG